MCFNIAAIKFANNGEGESSEKKRESRITPRFLPTNWKNGVAVY